MSVLQEIQKTCFYLKLRSAEYHYLKGFQSIWFWLPLVLLNYWEYHFQIIGSVYFLIVLIFLYFTWDKSIQKTHGAYFLDYLGKTKGEVSAWYENQQNPFAYLLLKEIEEKYPLPKISRLPSLIHLLWFIPLGALLFYPIFRGEAEWKRREKRSGMLEKLEQMSQVQDRVSSDVKSELTQLKKLLAEGKIDVQQALKELKKVEAKAQKRIAFGVEEQKLVASLLKEFPEIKELLKKKDPKLIKILEKEGIANTLQKKILEYSPKELEKALAHSKEIDSPLFTLFDSLLLEKKEKKRAKDLSVNTLNEKIENEPLSWPEVEGFPLPSTSPRFAELLKILPSTEKSNS